MTMRQVRECVIDTVVLQKANAPTESQPRIRSQFRIRLKLLRAIQNGGIVVLISSKLLQEYRRQINPPRNDALRTFFSLLDAQDPRRVAFNWARWTGSTRTRAHKCRFPREDTHVLQTAIRESGRSFIVTEERRILQTDSCIYREFRVHATTPEKLGV